MKECENCACKGRDLSINVNVIKKKWHIILKRNIGISWQVKTDVKICLKLDNLQVVCFAVAQWHINW